MSGSGWGSSRINAMSRSWVGAEESSVRLPTHRVKYEGASFWALGCGWLTHLCNARIAAAPDDFREAREKGWQP